MTTTFILYALLLHWIFDFVLQSDMMALNKSKSMWWLAGHCFAYSYMAFFLVPTFPAYLIFFGYLFITHFIIDGITSRLNAWLWKKNEYHWFFTSIGLDQWLHYAALFLYLGI